ncbi:DUF1028 domain-containing protein [Vibrio coralliilyticus]|uniref:DUF1028 domain-containing protein n=1 Tax=Vibrio coralliilyticus TaxID=190893 RepID=UPI001561A3B5|nr:DUF1028 domain-containing protein [Vibrio coralliilyticus]NRF13750.1 DUF1028 domain-containing protein [Vibrio coralliilyticus]
MTISLIHVNPKTGLSASITATGGVAVGGYVNHSWRNLGGCATQGLFTNPWYADLARKCLTEGMSAAETVDALKAGDAEFSKRQCLVMDKNGNSAFIHGNDNVPVTGSIAFPTLAVAGNMLESNSVLAALADSFLEQVAINVESVKAGGVPDYRHDYEDQLPETLISALEKALQAGGDKRGTFSASLRVESMTKAPVDIRVDWADGDLIEALRKVLRHVRGAEFQEFLNNLPSQ